MEHLDPVLLRTWVRVARAGNLHMAAKELFMTQPAVSHQLKRLQEWMGEPLYRRVSHGIEATAVGLVLLRLGEQMEGVLDEAQAVRNKTKGLLRGSLCIYASQTNAEFLLPPIIAEYFKRFPAVPLRFATMNSRQARMTREEADLIFTESVGPGSNEPSEWTQEVLVQTEISLLLPTYHPLMKYKSGIPISMLNTNDLIWREEGSGIREHALQALQKEGIFPDIRYEFGGLSAVRDAVRCGLGVGFISALTTGNQCQGLEMVTLKPKISHTLNVIYRKYHSNAVAAFLEILRPAAAGQQSIVVAQYGHLD